MDTTKMYIFHCISILGSVTAISPAKTRAAKPGRALSQCCRRRFILPSSYQSKSQAEQTLSGSVGKQLGEAGYVKGPFMHH